ncbi:MAG: TonB-dependent receptor, partial [Candidatus Neomarinimicrobiota bacterium]
MNRHGIFGILLILALSGFSVRAGTTGKIMGKVSDKNSGDPIIGANVYIEGSGLGTASDVNGDYFIINIPPGKYTLICSYVGYERVQVLDVQVNTDRTTIQNFSIAPQAIEGKEVTVIGTRKVIEMDRTNSAAYVSSEQIKTMPVQELGDLIQLQTGVVRDAGGTFHIRGGRGGEIAYLIDGVPVTDQYNGGSSIAMENNWVQELQVISGTFNAEYGQAQSGVVNVVTKEGAKKFGGSVSIGVGDYVTSNSDIFMGLGTINLNEKDLNVSLRGPVPVVPNLSFYTSLRYFQTDGWLYGERRVLIDDTVPIQYFVYQAQRNPTQEERLYGYDIPDSLMNGDGAYVPLNGSAKFSGYSKLSYKLTPKIKINYSLFYNVKESKSYSDSRRYSPDGIGTAHDKNYNHILSVNHVLSNSTFYNLNLSNYSKNTWFYLFENPLDSSYQGSAFSDQGFYFGGTQNNRYDILRAAKSLKFDLTSQMNKFNQVKIGFEIKRHKLDYNSSTTVAYGVNYEPPDSINVPPINTANNNHYIVKPLEASVYAQDKIEFKEIIVNVGLRFDYWDPVAEIPIDLRAETNVQDGIRLGSELKKADIQTQLSPRFGLAYPVSDNGVFHVSYGHFFQLPRFNAIYNNYEYEIELGGLETKMGNVNLKPEQTIAYELGLQQKLAGDISLDVTVYYKDIKNLLSQEIISTRDDKVYARYINRDYGNVKGFILSLNKAYSNNFSGGIDYTYQVAMGNASDPSAVFVNFQSNPPAEGEKQVVPLDWDQRHTLNSSLIFGDPSNWSFAVIARFATGQPYTPSNP